MKYRIIPIILIVLFACISAYAGTIDLPKTGQTTSYATGDDGDLQVGVSWPEPRFTNDNGSTPITGDVVVDRLTGFMWARNANLPGSRRTWQQALDYVAAMNSGSGTYGYTDWRLPNINELESLINAGRANPGTWLNGQGFTNVQSSYYWSSTTHAYYTDVAWIVYMGNGGVGGEYKSYYYYAYVWPVRAGHCGSFDDSAICLPKTGQATSYYSGDDGDLQMGVSWPAPRFVDNADSTVVDKLTGLMWSKNTNLPNGYKTWQEALDYVAAMNSGSGMYGYTDWRLPNRKELRSFCDYSKYSPALPQGYPFTNVQSDYYWSSTTHALRTDGAWVVDMNHGGVSYGSRSDDDGYVWPVRAGQCGPLDDWDNDTACNDVDNCPNDYNPRQNECDGDGTGDVCDPDTIDPDGDGIDQACDICWAVSNPGQQDTNGNCPAPPYTSDPKCGDACSVCGSFGDSDSDCILDDGDHSSIVGDNPCAGGQMQHCDDNCPNKPNGPGAGTCIKRNGGVLIGTGVVCHGFEDCQETELCDMEQRDCNDNLIGDACECYADCNHDGKVILSDLVILKTEFGRTDCAVNPCQADANGDGKVVLSDLVIMKTQFGKTGCPVP